MKSYVKKTFHLLGDYQRRIPRLLLLFLSSSFLDLAGIGLIGPYVALIVNPELFIQSDLYVFATSLGVTFDMNNLIAILGSGLVLIFLLKTLSALYINKSILRTCYQHGVDLRSLLMSVYQGLPYDKYLQRNSSEYIYNIQVAAANFTQLQQSALRLVSEGLVAFVILMLLAWSDLFALGVLIFLLGLLIFVHDLLFRKKMQEYGKLGNVHSTRMLQYVHEGVEGLKEIRILGRGEYFHKKVRKNAEGYSNAAVSSIIVSTMPRYFLELVLVVFIILLVFKSIFFSQNLDALLPTISMFGVAAMRLVPSANQIISSVTRLRHGMHSIDILYDDLKEFLSVHSLKEGGNWAADKKERSFLHESFHSLKLKRVCFSYPKANKKTLNNVSITVRAGDTIGIIGSSGSGKTTMIDLLLGLLEADSGEVLYNNKPLSEGLEAWRSNVGYLPQQVFLTDDTLRKNIALGVDEENIDESKVLEAIRQARLTKLVSQLSDGVNTILGEKGIRLSGGQRQRVALARAFYHNSNVLIMDESTSSLDNETENEIVEEIKRLKGEKTIIVIAHRLKTLEHCEHIYRMDSGELVESGSYESVIGKSDK